MIHYHGLPITPETAAIAAVSGGHAFVSFAGKRQVAIAIDVCQSFAVDNGAFSAWKSGCPIEDWTPYYRWLEDIGRYPNCDWAVIPDVIGGTDEQNDELIRQWPHGSLGVPVWHLNSSLSRLEQLIQRFPRICIGSAGEYSSVGSAEWWARMAEVMRVACDQNGYPRARFHGLRMLSTKVFSRVPLTSADSTNIGRNIGIDSKWKGTYLPPTKEARALVLRQRIEAINAPAKWTSQPIREGLFA